MLLSGAPADGAQSDPVNAAQAASAPPVETAHAQTALPAPAFGQAVSAPTGTQDAPVPPPATPPEPSAAPGEIVVSGELTPRQDPMQAVNQASYDAIQAVDTAVIGPVAMGYKAVVPRPVRTGLRNFLSNLTEPIIALNFLLQLKPGKAAETVGRFAVNSTVGVGGLIDVAKKKPFNLPYRRNGFAYTMGYHGVGPGPYMFLPLVGPTTLRDVVGLTLDRFLLPFAVGGPLKHPAYVTSSFVIRSLDERVESDDLFKQIQQESNPYASYRQFYLKRRQDEIDALRGKITFPKEGGVVLPAVQPPVEAAPTAPAEAISAPVQPPERVKPVFVSIPVVQPIPGQ